MNYYKLGVDIKKHYGLTWNEFAEKFGYKSGNSLQNSLKRLDRENKPSPIWDLVNFLFSELREDEAV